MTTSEDTDPCAYCDQNSATTRDHVVPLCLFSLPRPQNLVTVPACEDCNRVRKSKDDTFLRDYLTSDFAGHKDPDARKLFDGKVKRSIKRNQSELAKLVQQGTRKTVPVRTRAGIYTGEEATIVPLPDGRIAAILFEMCRGLYFHSQKRRLPSQIPYEVLRREPDAWKRLSEQAFNKAAGKRLGDVFECRFIHATEDPSITLWLLLFYRRIVFTVETGSG